MFTDRGPAAPPPVMLWSSFAGIQRPPLMVCYVALRTVQLILRLLSLFNSYALCKNIHREEAICTLSITLGNSDMLCHSLQSAAHSSTPVHRMHTEEAICSLSITGLEVGGRPHTHSPQGGGGSYIVEDT